MTFTSIKSTVFTLRITFNNFVLGYVWNHVCVCVCVFIFLFYVFVRFMATVHVQCINSSYKVWLFLLFFFSQSVHTVYCSWTHKFHFSTTFSLKMGPTILFTHLKIILLQYFSVFSFSFQFSAVSKQTLSAQIN